MAEDNGVAPLPRRAPGVKRRPESGPLARPVLSASDLERIRAALDSAENGGSTQEDAVPAVLPAPLVSAPSGMTDEIRTTPGNAAQPVRADAKLVPAHQPPAHPPRPASPKAAGPSPKPSRPRARGQPTRAITGGAILMLLLLSAGSAFLLTRHADTARPRTSADTVMAIRDRAAAWVASQVSWSGLVSCEQVMCRALEAHDIPAADLLVLRPGGPDLLRSSVIVVTAAVTRMMGSQLISVDAPATIAAFGSGSKRVSIRMIFARGAAAYASALRDGLAARKANESSGLLNPRITMSVAAHRQLTAGQVDARLVLTIANLATVWPVNIITFGDRAPGASPGIPLRCAELALTGGRPGAHLADQARLMAVSVHRLGGFYSDARIRAVRLAGGRDVVQVGFTAPSPLGWLSTSAP